MRYSKTLIKTFKETPKDADNISAALLLRGSYIKKISAGIYDFLPLGWRVLNKISEIIKKEMVEVGASEVLLPTLQPKEYWDQTNRWKEYDPPLFTTRDRHEKEFAIGPTHEEMATDMAKNFIESYKDLPKAIFQIQNKFRNEMRSTGGLLRVREFLMKDAYSFHASQEDLEKYYEAMRKAYSNIFQKMGIEFRIVEAHSGSIGGKKSNEFMLMSESGEDTIYLCGACDYSVNAEVVTDFENCPKCGGEITEAKAIEIGHIFDLGDIYSAKMNLVFLDKDSKRKPVLMGCYGIGIGRLMAAIVEARHDEAGIVWPEKISPYQVYLIDLEGGNGEEICQKLESMGIEVLWDDRATSAGVKFSEADLLGFPYRVVLSAKTEKEGKIEVKKRDEKESRLIDISEIERIIKKN